MGTDLMRVIAAARGSKSEKEKINIPIYYTYDIVPSIKKSPPQPPPAFWDNCREMMQIFKLKNTPVLWPAVGANILICFAYFIWILKM